MGGVVNGGLRVRVWVRVAQLSHGGSSWSHDSHTGDVGVPSPLLKVPAGQVAAGLGGGGEGEGEDGGVTQQACLHFAESLLFLFLQSLLHFLWPTPPQPGFALGLHRRCTFFESFFVHVVGSSSCSFAHRPQAAYRWWSDEVHLADLCGDEFYRQTWSSRWTLVRLTA